MNKKILALMMAALMLTVLLAGCATPANTGTPEETPADTARGEQIVSGYDISVCLASEPDTIDPALASATDAMTMLQHFFEGLMKWADDGSGNIVNATLVNGQAESYEKTQDGDNTVYTFTLRNDIKWSDGKDVTADDFVYAWRRAVDPETAADYSYMLDMVLNANEIMEGEKDPSELGIEAVDEKTLKITLFFDCPYFLEVCAFPVALPVREDVILESGDQWTFSVDTYITNGTYKMTKWEHDSYILAEKNPTHYDYANLGPDSITFRLMDDENAMLSAMRTGELDLTINLPVDEIPALREAGEITIADYIGTYYACFQTQKAPFDDARVRKAFSLVIDRNYIVENITRTGEGPASAYVPAGIYDAAGPGSDFREIGGEYYSVNADDYQKNCDEARALLAEAGFPNGEGFPTVEYLYNTNDRHKAIAEAMQQMWKTELNVNVTLQNEEWGTFLQTRKNGDFQIARNGWIGDYNDPMCFLDMFETGGGNNDAQYSNPAYDSFIREAKSTSVSADRMRAMHEAEDTLLNDSAVAPIYFYKNYWMLNPDIEGMFYTPLGYMFFNYIKR